MKRDPKTGKLPPKKRNDRALMLARERRVCRSRKAHSPIKKFAYHTRCVDCGIKLSWNPIFKKYVYG
jgi:hypothetical protein